MIAFTRFNIVLVGSFDAQSVDLSDFDFHGRTLVEKLRLAPMLQATAAEYTLEIIPGRFQLSAEAAKATDHRVAPMKDAAIRFANEYAGRRSIFAVGFNLAGDLPAHALGPEFMGRLVALSEIRSAVDVQTEILSSVSLSWEEEALTRLTCKFEVNAKDHNQVIFDANYNIGEISTEGTPARTIPIPVEDAIGKFTVARDTIDRVVSSVVEKLGRAK